MTVLPTIAKSSTVGHFKSGVGVSVDDPWCYVLSKAHIKYIPVSVLNVYTYC